MDACPGYTHSVAGMCGYVFIPRPDSMRIRFGYGHPDPDLYLGHTPPVVQHQRLAID